MVHVSGRSGELRVGYQRAALLGEWTITPSSNRPNTFTFHTDAVEENPHWYRQSPLDLVLALGTTEWVWRNVSILRDGPDMYVELTERPAVSQRARGNR